MAGYTSKGKRSCAICRKHHVIQNNPGFSNSDEVFVESMGTLLSHSREAEGREETSNLSAVLKLSHVPPYSILDSPSFGQKRFTVGRSLGSSGRTRRDQFIPYAFNDWGTWNPGGMSFMSRSRGSMTKDDQTAKMAGTCIPLDETMYLQFSTGCPINGRPAMLSPSCNWHVHLPTFCAVKSIEKPWRWNRKKNRTVFL